MKVIGVCLGALLLAVALLGCPYESKVPLGAPQARAIDTLLTGYWVVEETDGKGALCLLQILPFNEAEYVFAWTEKDSEPEYYRGFQVQVSNQLFWNFSTLKTTSAPDHYFFGRSTMSSDGQLTMAIVGEDGVPEGLESDSQGLFRYIEAHVNDSSLFDEGEGATMRRPAADEVEDGRLSTWGK